MENGEQQFIAEKSAKVGDDELIRIRTDKVVKFFKEKYFWLTYVVLAVIVFLAVRIRTRNLSGLKDITTGGWALGPDLDPWLFHRWAEYIVEHGSIMTVDTMRYVPLGFDTRGELLLHPYMMAWLHKFLAVFHLTDSLTYSAVIYPVVMFALTVVAFFFFAREIFVDSLGEKKANVIGLVSAFFLSVIPALLPRTIAGIPEKESAAFLFMFLAFFFFLKTWKSKNHAAAYTFALLAGLSTAAMALIWGGYIYLYIVIGFSVFISFFLLQVNMMKFVSYCVWLFSSTGIILISSSRYSLSSMLYSTTTGVAFAAFALVALHFLIHKTSLEKFFQSEWIKKIPKEIVSLVVFIIVGIVLSSIFFGPSFIFDKIDNVKGALITPITDRLGQTVAENRQPYFTEWAASFGPTFLIPLTFWLFIVGSIYLFTQVISFMKREEKIKMTIAYVVFLFALVFSRYDPSSNLNGTNFSSKFLYVAGFGIFVLASLFYYYRYNKTDHEKLRHVDFSVLLLFVLFFLSIVSARGAVRLIMVLVIPVSIIISYFVLSSYNLTSGKEKGKIFGAVIFVLILIGTIFAAYSFYKESNGTAQAYVPSIYNQQWQKAMSWIREETPNDAVFGHWWDYGYWVQSIGKRATVLDGGNAKSYWNHLMGRYALTGTSDLESLEFLYAHNTTHFLIDSTDIGKYGAFSFIGSNENYDRRSQISTFIKDGSRIEERKNSTVFVYSGGAALEEDLIYEENGSRIFLPAGQAGVGAVLIERDSQGEIVGQPIAVFVNQGRQYAIPLRYFYENEFLDFGTGIDHGVFIFPAAAQTANGIQIDNSGAMMYLTKRTVKSQLARLYLYEENNQYFKLAHSEDDFVVAEIKAQNPAFTSDFVLYQGFRGPIRIWEINYPEDVEFREEYLSTDYPKELLV